MPLQLADVSTERPQVIVYDPQVAAEARDAAVQEAMLVRQGFLVERRAEGMVVLQPPPSGDDIHIFRVLTDNGDDRIVWDRTKPGEVRDAFKKFKDFLSKGYRAYATLSGGKKGHRIDEFEPGLQEVLLLEKEVLLVPPTVPG